MDYRALIDLDHGTVDRRIFFADDIYETELERIFARAWNFMCHESQIPSPGDFFLNFIGEESVIATRDRQGRLQVLLNTCRHRGNAVCRAELGHARSFMCTYHGWTYDLEGRLIGVPGYKNFYHENLKREDWGLVKAAKVESYKGLSLPRWTPPRRRSRNTSAMLAASGSAWWRRMATWRSWTASRNTASAATGNWRSTICSTGITYRSAMPPR